MSNVMGRRWIVGPGLVTLIVSAVGVLTASPAAAGGGCGEPVTDRHAAVVEAKDFCFFPTVVRTAVDTTVTFVNRDGAEHTVSALGGGWGGGLAVEGAQVIAHFTSPGTYPYFCHLHLGMIGVVVVGDGAPNKLSATPTVEMHQAPAAPITPVAATRTPEHERANRLPLLVLATVPLIAAAYVTGRLRRPRRNAVS
jgi:plastocyanin